jgi:hypothetical protein
MRFLSACLIPGPLIRSDIKKLNQEVVVLDDDPTGTQTMHDTVVLTERTLEALSAATEDSAPTVFVMHNSRSMSHQRASTEPGNWARTGAGLLTNQAALRRH